MSLPTTYPQYVFSRRYVAFIDILGFEEMVTRLRNGQEELLGKITLALDRMAEHSERVRSAEDEVVVTAFSDNIVLSVGDLVDQGLTRLLIETAVLCGLLLGDGIFVRGGIALGTFHHDKRILFGDGLISAYKMERSVAVYPRVVFSDEVTSEVRRQGRPLTLLGRRDFDEVFHLDYLNPDALALAVKTTGRSYFDFERGRQGIIEALERASEMGVRAKLRWLAKYFNESARAAGAHQIDLEPQP